MLNNKYRIVLGAIFLVILLSITANAQIKFDLANLRNQDSALTKAYDLINIQNAWEKISGISLSDMIIGIVDTGIDSKHQEFNNPKVNIDAPVSALFDSNTPKGHGTQVIGIIGANSILGSGGTLTSDNPQMNGILSGVLKETQYKLVVENINLATSTIQTIAVFAALENVLKRNPQLVNLSLTLEKCSSLSLPVKLLIRRQCAKTNQEFSDLDKSFQKIFNSHPNKLFITSAGNEDIDFTFATPTRWAVLMDNVISVGATDLDDGRAIFPLALGLRKSNFGTELNISAPGINVYAPKPDNQYDPNFSGTSASTPLATGVAGLIKAIKPELNPAQIKDILTRTADPIKTDKPLGSGCFDPNNNPNGYTGCRLNAFTAVCDPLVLNCAPTLPPQPSNTWKAVGPMTTERADHTATLLNDSRVLITGGFKGNGSTFTILTSAEIFDPITNTFTAVGNMTTPRTFHTATLLPDGRVLIVGGIDSNGLALKSAEIFNPQTNSFTFIGNMNEPRFYHTADLLNNGKILIAGGNNVALKSTEIFDPSINAFISGPDMTVSRSHAASALLNDGRILIVNGLLSGTLMTVDIYNPNTNSFGSATSSAEQLGLSVTSLPDGKVFIGGGKLFNQPNGLAAEVFDSQNNSFIEVGPMLFPTIARQASVLLQNNKILIIDGGLGAQLFNPLTNAFEATGNLNVGRVIRHRLTLLQDGRALLAGGQVSETSFITTAGADVYQP